jgi:hypothetical protein
MQHPGWALVIVGLVIAGIGAIWRLAHYMPWLVKLPGDIAVQGKGFRFYFPVMTCIVLILLLTGVVWLVRSSPSEEAMKNSIFVIKPYKWNGMWVFDDERVGLDKEPFVAGADTMIDTAVQLKGIPKAEDGFLLVFSARPFPDTDFEVEWVRGDSGGNVYKGRFEIEGEVQEMEGWLCPALSLYFPEAPKKLYVQVREAK